MKPLWILFVLLCLAAGLATGYLIALLIWTEPVGF